MKDLIVFGTGKIAACMTHYFERDSAFRIHAYTCDREFVQAAEFQGRPALPFDEIQKHYPPESYVMFVALGYQRVNRLRKAKYLEAKERGYSLVSYVSPKVEGSFVLGDNCAVMDGAVIQPFAEFDNDVFVWGGAMVGHHARIGSHCWITGSANIGGSVELQEGSFVGLNATIGQEVRVGRNCVLGANSLSTRDVPADSVVVVRDTELHRLKTDQFIRLSSCF